PGRRRRLPLSPRARPRAADRRRLRPEQRWGPRLLHRRRQCLALSAPAPFASRTLDLGWDLGPIVPPAGYPYSHRQDDKRRSPSALRYGDGTMLPGDSSIRNGIRPARRPWLLLLLLLLPGSAFGVSVGREHAAPPLQRWPADLDLLATDEEKQLFSGLREDAAREMFFRQFWQARDPFPQTVRNELREAWESRLAEAQRRWYGVGDDRSRVLLLRGEPSAAFEAHCPQSGSFEVWTYE